jgi:adenosylmethionine-8-amino-7-oxononanoate aminotransferase
MQSCISTAYKMSASSSVLHRSFGSALPVVAGGDGCWLVDTKGRRYLDASGGAAVSCLGHGHAGVAAAIRAQLDSAAFVHSSFFTNAPAEALATRLVALAPPGFGAGRVAFLGSGSEAMEAALKLARQYHVERGEPGRVRFISRRMSYHGNTLGALAIGGHVGRRAIYQPLLPDTVLIPPCHPYREARSGETAADYGRRAADALEAAILAEPPGSVAAFIAEPVAGATLGSVPPVPGYFARIREICDRHGVLFIADEVMCGMGRCGAMFVCGDEGVAPDLITIAKGLGAGYQPIAAVMASQRVVDAIAAGSGALANGHTYMSHPVACAAALGAVAAIETLLLTVRRQGAVLEAALRARFARHAHVGDIRGRGLFWTIELVADRAGKTPFPARLNLAALIKAEAMARGLICYPSAGSADGGDGDHVLLAPPFIISDAEIALVVDRVAAAIDHVLADVLSPA